MLPHQSSTLNWAVAIAMAMGIGFLNAGIVAAQPKTDVCHFKYDVGEWQKKEVNVQAAERHLDDHDDAYPGGTTTQSGTELDDDCKQTQTACSLTSLPDTDSDRLPDCVETNTGTFITSLYTGTDPNDADSDNDNIDDGDEVFGTLAGLDLPGLGVDPNVPTILIEHDWFDDSGHSHRPTAAQINMVTDSFAHAGVQIIHDYGQGPAPFDRGNLIADADGNVDGLGSEYYAYKAANFDANRNGYFHYNLFPHQYDNGFSSGLAEINGDDLITATINFYTNNLAVAGTIQHALGHNLNLRHGGFENLNYKPNYNSVMSYNYQFGGVDTDCIPDADGVLDYSNGINPDLNETNLDETQGICGGPSPFDWNQDTDATDVGIAVDINHDWNGPGPYPPGDGILELLKDHDDWSNLFYSGILDGDGADDSSVERVSCQEVAEHMR